MRPKTAPQLLSPIQPPCPSTSPSPSPSLISSSSSSQSSDHQIDFSPPLIAMVVVVAAAFFFLTYSRLISQRFISPLFCRFRRWRHRRRRLLHLSSIASSPDSRPFSPPFPFDSFHYSNFSPYGLDDSVIKTLPLFLFTARSRSKSAADLRDCAVCLLEFEDGDYVRTLPSCSHAFHVDCIDEWLRAHPNCPLCRARILVFATAPRSPFVPLMASRIRPSLDNEADAIIIRSIAESPTLLGTIASVEPEISVCMEDISPSNHPSPPVRFGLKRSYSFGFERGSFSERGSVSERLSTRTESVTASPWRQRRSLGTFWNKRPSPFGSLAAKPGLFSFRYYRGTKSPFFRRRSSSFFPLSERLPPLAGGSSRRRKSSASPMFLRPALYSSSRLRCGDPEALLSPERYNRR